MDKRDQILQAALQLFAEFGLHGTPTSKIAEVAKVSNGTLFNYFKTKDELIIALYSDVKSELNSYFSEHLKESDSIQEKIKGLFCKGLEWAIVEENKILFLQLVSTSPNLDFIPTKLRKKLSFFHHSILEEAVQKKIVQNLSAELISDLAGGVFFSSLPYLRSLPLRKRKQGIEEIFGLLWKMISL